MVNVLLQLDVVLEITHYMDSFIFFVYNGSHLSLNLLYIYSVYFYLYQKRS